MFHQERQSLGACPIFKQIHLLSARSAGQQHLPAADVAAFAAARPRHAATSAEHCSSWSPCWRPKAGYGWIHHIFGPKLSFDAERTSNYTSIKDATSWRMFRNLKTTFFILHKESCKFSRETSSGCRRRKGRSLINMQIASCHRPHQHQSALLVGIAQTSL